MAPPKLEDLKEEEKPTPFPPRGDPRWKYSKILLQGVHIESISSARNPCHPYNNHVWARNPCNVLDAAAPLREHLYSNEWNWKACRFAGSAGMPDLSLLIHYWGKFCTFCTLHRRQLDQSGRFLLSDDLEILTTLVISWLRVHNLVSSRFDNMQEKKVWKCYCKLTMMKIVCGAQSDLLWFYSMFTICFCTPIWTGPPIKADVPTFWPHCVSHSQPISFTSQDGRLWRCLQAWHDPGWPKLGCTAQGNG